MDIVNNLCFRKHATKQILDGTERTNLHFEVRRKKSMKQCCQPIVDEAISNNGKASPTVIYTISKKDAESMCLTMNRIKTELKPLYAQRLASLARASLSSTPGVSQVCRRKLGVASYVGLKQTNT